MLIEVSQIIVLGLGVLVFGLATWGFAQPARLMQLVTSSVDQPWGIYVAVITRLALGAALVGIAPASRFPITFQLLGVTSSSSMNM